MVARKRKASLASVHLWLSLSEGMNCYLGRIHHVFHSHKGQRCSDKTLTYYLWKADNKNKRNTMSAKGLVVPSGKRPKAACPSASYLNG